MLANAWINVGNNDEAKKYLIKCEQMPESEKCKQADFIIENNSDEAQLRNACKIFWKKIELIWSKFSRVLSKLLVFWS